MDNLENSLVCLLKILCPQAPVFTKLTDLRDGRVFYELLRKLSEEHFSFDEDPNLLESDRTNSYQWSEQMINFKKLQEQMNSYFKLFLNEEFTFTINITAIVQKNNEVEILRLLNFIFSIYIKHDTQKKLLIDSISELPENFQVDVVKFLEQLLNEQVIYDSENQNQQKLLLDHMDELQDQNYNFKIQIEVLLKDNLQKGQSVSSLKQLVIDGEVEITSLKKQLNNQIRIEEIESQHQSSVTSFKKQITALERILKQKEVEFEGINNSLKEEQSTLQSLKRENDQLGQKASQVSQLDQKLEKYKDIIKQERTSYQSEIQDKEKQMHRLNAQYKFQQEESQLLENKNLDIEIENQKLKQDIETMRLNSLASFQEAQTQLKIQTNLLEKLQSEQFDTCRSSNCAQSPRNLQDEFVQENEKQMQIQYTEQLYQLENKHGKQLQVQLEKIKTMEAVNQNLKQENIFNNSQKIDLEDKLKNLEQNQRKTKVLKDEEIEQLIEAKHEECMLLASVIYDQRQKYASLKSQMNQNLNKKVDQILRTPVLKNKNVF